MKTNGVKLRALFACLFFSVLSNGVFAQTNGVVRCYTDENDAILRANHPELESAQQFEQWIQSEMAANLAAGKIIGGVYQIPVVVHVIHSGTAIGSGANVSYAAIQSQIDVLNEDFRRIFGSNGWNTNPVGADTQIEFCLARRRPDGSAFPFNGAQQEHGVNRILLSTINTAMGTSVTAPVSQTNVENVIKAYTYNGNTPTATRGWDPAKYMNIWLCDLGNGLLGYAQFPQSPLGGMGCSSPVNGTDGVVFLYSSIGKSSVTGFPGPYNEGRTATHEIGHWLGLRHIWGDGGCSVDDYCNDTPLAAAANFGCPTINSCTNAPDPGNDMVENYMDYTDDACMNVFTNDQKQRMRAVLEGSPLRLSLINSDACTPPNPSDASITDVFAPLGDNCAGAITPSVQLKNRGSNNLTSATISYKIDNGTPVTFSWTGNLTPNSTATVALPAFTAPLGNHTFIAYSTLPNGITDPYAVYDTSGIDFAVSNGIMPNYTQDFEGQSFPPDVRWRVDNVNGDCFKWSPASGISSTGTFTNNIAQVPCYGNSSSSNEDLYTPVFLLPCNATAATLKFDVAYRKRTSTSNDQLIVQISTDCGATWSNVYSKSGNVSPFLYQTAATVSAEYFPTAAADWRTETISLMSYVAATSKNIRFRFRGVSANGNNIFIDNVKFEGTTPGEINVDVASTDVLDGGYYTYANTLSGGSTTATFNITNTGTTNLTLTNPITVTGTGFALGTGFGTTTVTPGSTTTFTVVFSPNAAGNFTGNVSFGTNDCDEGTYNFVLNGLGIVTPPVADFSAAQTTICQGSSVTFTNLSTYANSYAWTFTGGTPGTSTATNPTVTYNTAGTYAVTLVATNANGSDTETKTGYITVVASTATALPLNEGFTTTPFVPTGWSLINNNASPTSWARSTTVGNAPTAGNSMWFNNFAYNDSDDDVVRLKTLTFSGLSSAQMTFDVAYAPYDAANFDGLEVLVSTNCGSSFTSVYSKSNTTLATASAITTAFVPSTGQWRTETVDLTPYIGQANVIIAFKNLSGYGNNLYVDNINVTGVVASTPPTPSFSTASSAVCAGQSITYTNTSTGSPTSYSWSFPGGTPSTSTAANPTVTYSTAGTYNVVLTATNGSGSNTVTMTNYVTVNAVPAAPTITAGGATTFCSGGSVTLTSSSGNSYLWSTGATSQSITATTAGTYTVQVTNASGCQSAASATTTITVNPTPSTPTITAGGATTFCSGGSVTLTSSSGNSYLWSTGATSQSITATTAGTYTVQVTNASGCQSAASATTTITVNPTPSTPTITAGGATTFCPGGSVTLTSSSGNSYLWSTGATSQSITATTAGTYTVQVTNASGCQSAASAGTTITVNPTPAAPTITAGGATTFCSGGSVTLTSSSGNSYLWSTGATSQSITATTAGTYTVQVTNASGCQSAASATTTITVNPTPSTPTITAGGATTFCSGGSVTLTSSSGNSYLWSTGATTQSITATTAGTYTVQVTNASGCQSAASATTTVTVNPTPAAPTITAGGATTFCPGGSVTLTSSSGNSYLWSTGATSQSITATTAGTYMVQVTNASGCQSAASATTTVTVNPTPAAPTITASGATTFCPGGSVTLTSSSGNSYLWSTGATSQSITATTAGTYTVQVTNASGCQSAASAGTTITVNPTPAAPTITAGGATTFCSGGSVTLTSSSGNSYLWSTGATTQSITATTAGTYTVQVTNASGCQSAASATTTVTVNPTPAITLGTLTNPSACASATGSIDVNGTGSGSVSWSGTASGTASVASLPTTIPNLAAGSYTIVLTSGAGCVSNSITGSLTDPGSPTPPVITPSSTILCPGGAVTLTSSYASGNTWSTASTASSISVTVAGTYTVQVTNAGCTSTSSPITITDAAPFSVNAGSDVAVCSGGSVTLTGASTGSPTLVWDNSVQDGVSFVPASTTTYTLTGTDGNGCQQTDQVTVTVNANPTVGLADLGQVCTYNPAFVLTGGSPSGGTYSGTGVSSGSFDPAVSGAGSFPITYTYSDANGCSGTAQSTIVVDPCLSVSENEKWNMSIYPNPSVGKIEILSDVPYSNLKMVDAQGKLIFDMEIDQFESVKVLDLSSYANGHYTLQVSGEFGKKYHQLVISK
ncbi:PKD domain-containing protein [Fluviicola chungangensis]|uniref:PKD domain-containing protein n=1 Tax=Fluviicola chungangensis TaxID=2597671 RepID=A0A556MRR0_9FLAO|nr:PKD domain-containing protein [Fluviicola chungangensis]TSJ42502.1 PKD domain-containing protein [Fluviicola chungangensis]